MTVKIEGLEEVTRKLEALNRPGIFYQPMLKSLGHLQRTIAIYPRKQQGAFSAMATPAQKRAFWAKVSSGEAEFREGIGYVRTGNLGRRWMTRVEKGGQVGRISNNAGYGPYVQSDEKQQPFHKASNWQTVEKVIDKESAAIVRYFEAAYKQELNK